jgi:hypothetical protein
MTDLFISYAREDRDTAHALAEALQRHGIDAWWDRELTGGGDFAHEIEQHLRAAPVAVVLWSAASVRSDFVRDESSRARDMHKLLPVRIAPVDLPLGFGTLHTLELLDWDGDPQDPACLAVVAQARQRLAQAGASPERPQPAAPAPAENSLGLRRRRRRLLLGAGVVGGAAVAGLGAFTWRHYLQREALDHLGRGLAEHFADPPRLERAQSEYASALDLDGGLALAHYFLAHLYAQLMLRGSPPPTGELLDALRADARNHFQQALAHAERLDGAQRVIARGQLALLSQEDAAPALSRPAPTDDVTAPPPPAPPPPATNGDGSSVATRPTAGAGTGTTGPSVAAGPGERASSPLATASPATGETGVAARRVMAAPAVAPAARGRGEALFATDRDNRLAATTSLTLDPAAAAESLPTAIGVARRGLRDTPRADGSPEAEALRQGLANTLALAERASPSTLRSQAAPLRALLSELAASPFGAAQRAATGRLEAALQQSAARRPVAYLQIAHEAQRPVAQALARRLEQAGYVTPGIELTGPERAPSRPSVRVQGTSDPDLARWCQRALAEAANAPAELVVLRRAQPSTDTFELWFDKALCAPGGRRVDTCA